MLRAWPARVHGVAQHGASIGKLTSESRRQMQSRLYSVPVQSVVSSLTVAQRDQLEMFAAMLMDCSKHTNLTGAILYAVLVCSLG